MANIKRCCVVIVVPCFVHGYVTCRNHVSAYNVLLVTVVQDMDAAVLDDSTIIDDILGVPDDDFVLKQTQLPLLPPREPKAAATKLLPKTPPNDKRRHVSRVVKVSQQEAAADRKFYGRIFK